MTENTIEEVFEELNFPSAARLKRVLDTRGISYKAQDVDRLVRREATRQVQAPHYKFDGKIAAADLNSRWFADLIDFTAAPSSDSGNDVGLRPTSAGAKYVLVAQDVFTRLLYTEAIANKRPETVTKGFDAILDKAGTTPKNLVTDAGAEWSGPFQQLLQSKGIAYQQKQKGDINAIATIDTAIGNLKKALARDTRKLNTNDWASRLQKVTNGQNNIPNEDYLEGIAPSKVVDSKDLMTELRRKNQEFSLLNRQKAERRAAKLETAGQFRAMHSSGNIGGLFTRNFKPRFEARVRQVVPNKTDITQVTDQEGNIFPTKLVQPVFEATQDSGPVRMEQRGSIQTRTRQAQILQPFADALYKTLSPSSAEVVGEDRRRVTTTQALRLLQSAFTPARFATAVAKARLNRASLLKNFLDVFPNMFEVDGKYVQTSRKEPVAGGHIKEFRQKKGGQGRLFVDDAGRVVIR